MTGPSEWDQIDPDDDTDRFVWEPDDVLEDTEPGDDEVLTVLVDGEWQFEPAADGSVD